jgi:hypothetical protein
MAAVTQDQMSEYMMTFQGMDPMTGQAMLIDPNSGEPLTDQMGNPTAPPLIVPVNSFDNHQAHIQLHNTYRKSQEYESLAPETKALFEEHVNQHMVALGMMPGAPAPGPGQNSVTSGGFESGQVPAEMLQAIAGGGMGGPEEGGVPPEMGAPESGPPPPQSGPPPI